MEDSVLEASRTVQNLMGMGVCVTAASMHLEAAKLQLGRLKEADNTGEMSRLDKEYEFHLEMLRDSLTLAQKHHQHLKVLLTNYIAFNK
jgi:hypothetical protein